MNFNTVIKPILSVLVLLLSAYNIQAQDDKSASPSAAQANNPLASMTAINVHNYYMPRLSNAPDESYMNTSWVRFAKPMASGKLLLRVSAPISTIGAPNTSGGVTTTSGLGDINAFLAYSFISKPEATVGVGPLIAAPTATDEALGTGKWQAGLAFVAFIAKSPVFQFGSLLTWQASFAGDSERDKTSLGAFQPFYFWQLGKGTYLRGAPIWVLDFQKGAYSLPVGIGIGKVVKMEKTVFNVFVEPQYSMYVKGVQPVFQLFAGINVQLIN